MSWRRSCETALYRWHTILDQDGPIEEALSGDNAVVEAPVKEDRLVKLREIATGMNISNGLAQTIVHGDPQFKNSFQQAMATRSFK